MFLHLLIVLVVGQLQGSYCTVTTIGDVSVLEGQSVTVPCYYNPQYTSHVKYWCHGRMREFCTSLARSDDPESAPNGKGRVTITDDPTQHVFTVSMRDLMEGDSGWYWCGVEIGGMWVSDSVASLYIGVIEGMSVLSSTVSAEEGGSVNIQCIYSQTLRSSDKRWCRGGDWSSCVVTDSNGTFSSRHVLIHDDRNSRFTVTLLRLEMRHSGWYWCGAGQQQVAVLLTVTPRATTPSSVQIEKSTDALQPVMKSNDSYSQRLLESPLVVCGFVLLVLTAFLAIWKLWQQCKKHKHRGMSNMNDNLTMCPWRNDEYKNTSVIFLNTPAQQVHLLS